MKRITKPKGLEENLMNMKIDESAIILSKDYKQSVVKSTVYRLNKKGYHFKPTEKKLIDCIRVTRLK